MRRISVVTVAIALLLGAAAAWWGVPRLRVSLALRDITATYPDRRAAAWRTLSASDGDEPPPALQRLDQVNERLAGAGIYALLHASDALNALHAWGWSHQPAALVMRELEARASLSDPDQHRLVIEGLRTCPLDVEPRPFLAVVTRLLDDAGPELGRDAWDAAAAWAGRERGALLESLPVPDDDALRRRRELVLGACGSGAPADVDAWLAMPVEVAEAAMMRHVLARPDDGAPLVETAKRWSSEPAPAFAAILRYATDPASAAALERLADDGDRAARFALQATDPDREDAIAERVATDGAEPAWRRRLAAWRWRHPPRELVDELLALSPAAPDGSVYATVLLAERSLPEADAAALAESWIRDFDDDRKRAGALLAALLGAHGPLVEQALDGEDVPAVRTAERLALAAHDRDPGPGDAREFAFRAMHRDDGDVDPDVACAMLAAGMGDVTRALTAPPPDGWRDGGRRAQARSWLLERFVPTWHDRLGRPLGALRELRLHFETLDAMSALDERRLGFDPAAGTFRTAR
jgi:hypothetical protein